MDQQMDTMVWAGTEQGLHMYLETAKKANALMASGQLPTPAAQSGDQESGHYLMQVLGATAVIGIYGSIKSVADWYDPYFGTPSYPALTQALYQAAAHPDVRRIVLDIHSQGGQTSGIYETSNLIERISRTKTVVAVATGDMCSAAYWLGCSADMVIASPLSIVGSIGVVAAAVDQSEMLSKAGIKVTMFRSGDHKMKPHPAEPLDKFGTENMEYMVNTLDAQFVAHVARRRNVTEALVRSKLAGGRLFIGQDAVSMGLVDSVASMNTVLSLAMQGKFDKVDDDAHNSLQIVS